MYVPAAYHQEDQEAIRNFVRNHPFATLITQVDGRPWATHLPMLLIASETGEYSLEAHLARANPATASLIALAAFAQVESSQRDLGSAPDRPSAQALAIFSGPHSYVSSSWYAEEEVSTWNYTAIHIYGSILLQSKEELMDSLSRLTQHFELGQDHPRLLEDMEESTLRQADGVIGFRMQVEEIHAARKLSQNRNNFDHSNIVRRLSEKPETGAQAIARLMKADREASTKSKP